MSVGMALFKKKTDPLSDRSRALNSEIAALEAQIKALDSKLHDSPIGPRLRSTARPHGSPISATLTSPREPVFEPVDHHRVKAQSVRSGVSSSARSSVHRRYPCRELVCAA